MTDEALSRVNAFDHVTWRNFRDELTVLECALLSREIRILHSMCDIKHSILCTEEIAWTYGTCCCFVVSRLNKVLNCSSIYDLCRSATLVFYLYLSNLFFCTCTQTYIKSLYEICIMYLYLMEMLEREQPWILG